MCTHAGVGHVAVCFSLVHRPADTHSLISQSIVVSSLATTQSTKRQVPSTAGHRDGVVVLLTAGVSFFFLQVVERRTAPGSRAEGVYEVLESTAANDDTVKDTDDGGAARQVFFHEQTLLFFAESSS